MPPWRARVLARVPAPPAGALAGVQSPGGELVTQGRVARQPHLLAQAVEAQALAGQEECLLGVFARGRLRRGR